MEELLQALSFQVAELEAQAKAADVNFNQMALETLREDDRLLASLQKLANDLDPGSPEDDHLARRIRELCARYLSQIFQTRNRC